MEDQKLKSINIMIRNKKKKIENEFTQPRLFLYPIKHHGLWEICEKLKKNTWFVDSMDFTVCENNFKKLTNLQQIIVRNGLIAATVLEDYIKDTLGDVMGKLKMNEIKHYLIFCQSQEETHSYGYQKLLKKYCGEKSEKIYDKLPGWLSSMQTKISKFFDECGDNISEIILGLACMESMLFHETFIIPYAIKCDNLLPVLIALNSEISRDENIHAEFWCTCLDMICYLKKSRMNEIIDYFFDIGTELCIRISKSKDILKECKIVDGDNIEGFNSVDGIKFEDMKTHLFFLKNKLQKRLGIEYKIVKTPLTFMSLVNSYNRNNFFVGIPTDYNKVYTKNLELIKNF